MLKTLIVALGISALILGTALAAPPPQHGPGDGPHAAPHGDFHNDPWRADQRPHHWDPFRGWIWDEPVVVPPPVPVYPPYYVPQPYYPPSCGIGPIRWPCIY